METEVGEPRNAPHKGGFAPTPMESVAVAIVGGGQAGLATSRELTKAGLEHVVLERGRVGETWRNRWDSLCLVTPNWSVQLPDGHYAGPEPDGFMPRDEFVTYLERYAAQSQVPIREHVDLTSVESLPGDGFVLRTRLATLMRKRWSLRPVPISVHTGQRRLRRCQPSWPRSMWTITATSRHCPRERC